MDKGHLYDVTKENFDMQGFLHNVKHCFLQKADNDVKLYDNVITEGAQACTPPHRTGSGYDQRVPGRTWSPAPLGGASVHDRGPAPRQPASALQLLETGFYKIAVEDNKLSAGVVLRATEA